MSGSNKHVVPNGDGSWGVKSQGASRNTKNFSTQKEAIKYGTNSAKKNNSELFIHGRDGKIRERNSYGNDPYPPKG